MFYAIGNYNPDGSFDSNGIAIFDDGATGELSFLSNSAGIYKDQVDKNGTWYISYGALEIETGEVTISDRVEDMFESGLLNICLVL